jgi:multidrug resistance efflux pump
MAAADSRIPTPPAQRRENFRQRSLPLIVWCACAVVAVGMLLSRARRFEYVGMANAPAYEISSRAAATISSVTVGLYEKVGAGDVVAVLDDAQVNAAIETARANVRRLTAEMDTEKAGLGGAAGPGGMATALRRFAVDEDRQRLEALSIKVTLEADRVELERRGVELHRAEALRAEKLLSDAEFDNARLLYEEVRRRNEENEHLLQEAEDALRRTQTRRGDYENAGGGPANEPAAFRPLREAINVEIQRLKEVETQREALVLKSPVAGRVSRILAARGQSVVAGEPILLIEEESVREIVAYLREGDIRSVAPNSKVRVTSVRSGRVADSIVVAVAPGLEALPQRLWNNPQVAEYGLGVTIAASPVLALTPGELVSVSSASSSAPR